MDAKKIWSYARRLLAIIPSIFICALGVALLVWPEWGCDPLTTFEIGLSNVFHVQFGTVALVFEGIMFFVFFFVRRDLVHLGTLAWCFLKFLVRRSCTDAADSSGNECRTENSVYFNRFDHYYFDIGLLYPDRFRISDIRYICVYGG